MSTNAQLSQQIIDLLAAWNEREAQFRAWLAGTSTGGPNSDGRYPLSDATGDTQLVDCPAKLADTVGGPAGLAEQARQLAETAKAQTFTARDRAIVAEAVVTALRSEVQADKALTLQYRNDAAAYASNLFALLASVGASEAAAEAAADAAQISEANAAASAAAAQAAADALEGFGGTWETLDGTPPPVSTFANDVGYVAVPSPSNDDLILYSSGAWTATAKALITDGGNF